MRGFDQTTRHIFWDVAKTRRGEKADVCLIDVASECGFTYTLQPPVRCVGANALGDEAAHARDIGE